MFRCAILHYGVLFRGRTETPVFRPSYHSLQELWLMLKTVEVVQKQNVEVSLLFGGKVHDTISGQTFRIPKCSGNNSWTASRFLRYSYAISLTANRRSLLIDPVPFPRFHLSP